jgi:hypothetical protein
MRRSPPCFTCGVVVGPGRLGAVAAVDEEQGERRGPVGREGRRIGHDGDDRAFEPGVVNGAPEGRQRVDLPDVGVDEVGLVPLPAGLVLLGPTMVVDREQDRVATLRRGAEVDRRLAAIAPDLEHRAADREGGRCVVQREPFVRGHEAACDFGRML